MCPTISSKVLSQVPACAWANEQKRVETVLLVGVLCVPLLQYCSRGTAVFSGRKEGGGGRMLTVPRTAREICMQYFVLLRGYFLSVEPSRPADMVAAN